MNDITGQKANDTMEKTLRRIASIFVVSVLLNFLWEVAQMPVYAEEGSWLEYAMQCIVPSLGDGIIVLMIFAVGVLVLRRSDWIDRPGITGYAGAFFRVCHSSNH